MLCVNRSQTLEVLLRVAELDGLSAAILLSVCDRSDATAHVRAPAEVAARRKVNRHLLSLRYKRYCEISTGRHFLPSHGILPSYRPALIVTVQFCQPKAQH